MHTHVFQGLKTSADKIFLVTVKSGGGPLRRVESLAGQSFEIERAILRPVVKGENVQRYSIDTSGKLFIIYPYRISEDLRATVIDQDDMATDFPRAWEYLNQNKSALGKRDVGLWASRTDWYAYARSQNIGTFVGEKLLIPYMTQRLRTAPDRGGLLFFVNITTGGYGFRCDLGRHDLNYVAGLLNSRLLDWLIRPMTNAFRGGYFAVSKQAIERLPFRRIDFSDHADKARHDRMVESVGEMLELTKMSGSAKSPSDGTSLKRQITAIDRQIDELVYQLYGLTNEEIRIVEGVGKAAS